MKSIQNLALAAGRVQDNRSAQIIGLFVLLCPQIEKIFNNNPPSFRNRNF